jgi:hypothetical protein
MLAVVKHSNLLRKFVNLGRQGPNVMKIYKRNLWMLVLS